MSKQGLPSLLKKLPQTPGVYKMKDGEGHILYVGKAKNLARRVKSYFRKSAKHNRRTQKLVEQIEDFEWIEVGSDLEAYMLETNLIKEYRPKYNVLMKDDKNFCYIKITKNETFPRIKVVRKKIKDGATYIGPKTSSGRVKKTLGLLQKLFMYRSCDLGMEWSKDKVKITKKTIAFPCLDYHIKRCAGPCISEISPEEYGESIAKIEDFLRGKTGDIENSLKEKMQAHVSNKDFEKAALIRDKLLAIESLQGQQIISTAKHEEMDIFAYVIAHGKAFVNLFQVRDGKLIDQENFSADAPSYEKGEESESPELLESILHSYYKKASDIPGEILVPIELIEDNFLVDWLQNESGHKVSVRVPQRGDKNKLIELARKNAESYLKQEQVRWMNSTQQDQDFLQELQNILKLSKLPKRIECYDISHLGGTNTVASMVVFENGVPKKQDYRKFRLRSIKMGEIDDFKSMHEILVRRLSYLSKAPKGIKFRKATKNKEKEMLELLSEWHDPPRPLGPIEEYILAFAEKRLVGIIRLMKGKNEAYLLRSLYVTPDFRGRGIARSLLRHSLKKMKVKRAYLSCKENRRSFYEELGFEEIKQFPKEFQKELEIFKGDNPQEKITTYAMDPGKNHDASFKAKPNLIVIDGGKGQLSSAHKALDGIDLEIPMISLAKREEEIFLPGKSLPILLPDDSGARKLLQRLRDEAHRFAITFQKASRRKELRASALDEIPGIGEKTKLKLLKEFGSVEEIKKAEKGELVNLLGENLASSILSRLK